MVSKVTEACATMGVIIGLGAVAAISTQHIQMSPHTGKLVGAVIGGGTALIAGLSPLVFFLRDDKSNKIKLRK